VDHYKKSPKKFAAGKLVLACICNMYAMIIQIVASKACRIACVFVCVCV